MTKLGDKLKGASPAPVVIDSESPDGGRPTRIELQVEDYEAAPHEPSEG